MTPYQFISRCEELFPGKDLTPKQSEIYRNKLSRYSDDQLDKLAEACLEHCKYFPKVADIYEQAQILGYHDRLTEYTPHEWVETNCRMCSGSGQVAAFWTQEVGFDNGPTQKLTLVQLMPYHKSAEYYSANKEIIRSIYRCKCEAGILRTVGLGFPRWTDQSEPVMVRAWR